jgi:hypothetical protein
VRYGRLSLTWMDTFVVAAVVMSAALTQVLDVVPTTMLAATAMHAGAVVAAGRVLLAGTRYPSDTHVAAVIFGVGVFYLALVTLQLLSDPRRYANVEVFWQAYIFLTGAVMFTVGKRISDKGRM